MRYAIRSMRNSPATALLAVASLSTGMGAVTLMFSIVDSVLLRPLPYAGSDRLVFVWSVPPKAPSEKRAATLEAYRAIREAAVVDHAGTIGGVGESAALAAEPGEAVEQIEGQRLSADVPLALGAAPQLGRWFTEAEAQDGSRPVIVISHRLWQRRYGGSHGVIGRAVRLDGKIATIIAVMPEGWMLFNNPVDYWAPYRVGTGASERVLPVARLRAGVRLEQAQAEMDRLAANLSRAFPAGNGGWGMRLEPAIDVYAGWIRRPLLIAQGVALIVMLVACANTAGMLIARATTRTQEIGVRLALGARPWRIARDLAFESALLSLCSIVGGVLIAYGGLKAFVLLSPAWFPRVGEIALHGRALAGACCLGVVTALAFGTIPAWQASRVQVGATIRGSSGTHRFRAALVVLEVAAALTLLMGASLMIRSFMRLTGSPAGCDTSNLMTFQVRFPEAPPAAEGALGRIRERISVAPGIEGAAFAAHAPFSDSIPGSVAFRIEGQGDGRGIGPAAIWLAVSSGYFGTLRAPVLRGREFGRGDRAGSPPVAMVNEAAARRYWPSDSPIGKRIALTSSDEPLREIVGVVSDIRLDRRAPHAEPQAYVPSAQTRAAVEGSWAFVVRIARGSETALAAARAIVAEEGHGLPMFHVKSVDSYIADQLWQPRQTMMLLSAFGIVALLLALCGVFGIVSYMVRQRTHEIGIRVALGATRRNVARLVLWHGLRLVALGIALGVLGSLTMAKALGSLLWGVTGSDAVTFAAAISLLLVTSCLACFAPAREATRVDPVEALRLE